MADWYYADGDIQRGPVSREKLVQLISAGQIAATDLVWTDTMGDWAPAGQVPGLIAGGGGAGRRADYEEGPPPKSGWEALSSGTKVGIVVLGGGGLLAVLAILLLAMLAPPDKPLPPPVVEEAPKPAAGPRKPPITATSNQPVNSSGPETVQTYNFDVKALRTGAEKRAYADGFRQGHDHIDFFAPAAIRAAARAKTGSQAELLAAVKEILADRDKAIYLSVKHNGLDSDDAVKSFGRRDGVKAWLKEHGLPVPD
jgi:hypothetical protein